jgi:hypothetical protein
MIPRLAANARAGADPPRAQRPPRARLARGAAPRGGARPRGVVGRHRARRAPRWTSAPRAAPALLPTALPAAYRVTLHNDSLLPTALPAACPSRSPAARGVPPAQTGRARDHASRGLPWARAERRGAGRGAGGPGVGAREPRGVGEARGLQPRLVGAGVGSPPPPTVAPTRVPTVYSLPLSSLADTTCPTLPTSAPRRAAGLAGCGAGRGPSGRGRGRSGAWDGRAMFWYYSARDGTLRSAARLARPRSLAHTLLAVPRHDPRGSSRRPGCSARRPRDGAGERQDQRAH